MTFLYNTKVFMDGKVLLDWKEAQADVSQFQV